MMKKNQKKKIPFFQRLFFHFCPARRLGTGPDRLSKSRPVPWQDFELVPLSLCPGTRKEFLSLCPEKLHCPVPLETLDYTSAHWSSQKSAQHQQICIQILIKGFIDSNFEMAQSSSKMKEYASIFLWRIHFLGSKVCFLESKIWTAATKWRIAWKHRLRTPNEAFFRVISQTFGLG